MDHFRLRGAALNCLMYMNYILQQHQQPWLQPEGNAYLDDKQLIARSSWSVISDGVEAGEYNWTLKKVEQDAPRRERNIYASRCGPRVS